MSHLKIHFLLFVQVSATSLGWFILAQNYVEGLRWYYWCWTIRF